MPTRLSELLDPPPPGVSPEEFGVLLHDLSLCSEEELLASDLPAIPKLTQLHLHGTRRMTADAQTPPWTAGKP
jgi:hypothetical protein